MTPGCYYFVINQNGLNKLRRGSCNERTFLQNYLEIRQSLSWGWVIKVLSFCPFSDVAWLPCFSTNQYGLNSFHGRPPKEHCYQIILESDMLIQRRRILKFWHFAPFLMPQQPKFSMEFKSLNTFERGLPKEHSCEVWLKLVSWFRRRLKLSWQTTDKEWSE